MRNSDSCSGTVRIWQVSIPCILFRDKSYLKWERFGGNGAETKIVIVISEMECVVILECETIKGRHDREFIFFFISTEGALRLPMTYDNHSIHPIQKASFLFFFLTRLRDIVLQVFLCNFHFHDSDENEGLPVALTGQQLLGCHPCLRG